MAEHPNPGSDEALALNCTCPVMDNARGEGIDDGEGGRLFWRRVGCPLHELPEDMEGEGK